MSCFVWRPRAYFRQAAGELLLGSLRGGVMNDVACRPYRREASLAALAAIASDL